MKRLTVGYFELKGTHYEVGHQLGELLGRKLMVLNKRTVFTEEEFAAAMTLYDAYCPGLCKEMHFAMSNVV